MTRPAVALTSFPELHDWCRANCSQDIQYNIDILYRLVWPRYAGSEADHERRSRQQLRRKVKHQVGSRAFLEYQLLKSMLKRDAIRRAPTQRSSVLVPFVAYRKDYREFVFPIVERLASKGLPVTVVMPGRQSVAGVPPTPTPIIGCEFLPSDLHLTAQEYRLAKRAYASLYPEIRDVCQSLGFNRWQSLGTKLFFMRYCAERVAFRQLTDKVEPSVVYGIHYMLHPGCAAAIRDAQASGMKLKSTLIQHGYFTCDPFHDFKGADVVFLWGEYFRDVLERSPVLSVPKIEVVGNPKLEMMRHSRSFMPISCVGPPPHACPGGASPPKGDRRPIVLFVSTPDPRGIRGYNAQALELFVQAMGGSLEWDVMYKPHPVEARREGGVFNQLLLEGLILPEQVVIDRSLYELIGQADVVVGGRSTGLLEAAALDRPVIQVLPELSGTDWREYGLETASTVASLQDEIRLLLEDRQHRYSVLEEQRRMTEAMFNGIDGASERIAAFLEGLL